MLRMFLVFSLLCTSLYAQPQIVAIAGSTRDGSYNKTLLKQAVTLASQMGAKVTVIDLKDYPLPFFDEDLEKEEGLPDKAKQIREMILQSDAVIVASPEYNGSLSGVLKNMIDWVSRPQADNKSAFKGKKFAIISTSPGQGGGVRGLKHLREILQNLGGTVVQQEVTIPKANEAFDQAGHLKNSEQKEALKKELQQLLQN